MKRIFILSFTLVLTVLTAFDAAARQLTPVEALRNALAANGGAQRKAKALGESTVMRLAYTAQRENTNIYYVFNNTEGQGGFVILGADDLAPAVLGYVDEGEFDYDQAPDNMKWWLSQYENGIGEAIRTGRAIERRAAVGRDAVWPLVGTSWNQDTPYNNMCPTIGGKATYSGCVATAMAQLMYYHRWPETGTGSHSYAIADKGLSLSADFGSTTYRWDDMLPAYETGKYTVSQAAAVATLMYHCGVSVDMNYGVEGSSASDQNLPGALMSYFGYDKGMTLEYRMFYTDEEWEDMVYGELDAGRPLYYSGATDRNEAHAFICDGYDGAGLYHFNWGWGGYCDGYFIMTGDGAIDPMGSGIGGGTVGCGYTNWQACLVGMQKAREDSEVKMVMGGYYGYTIESDGTPVTRNSTLTCAGFIGNLSAMPVDVEIGMMFKSTTTDDIYYTTLLWSECLVGYGWVDLTFDCKGVVKNGEYEVYPVYRPTCGKEWQKVRFPVGTEIPRVNVTGDGPKVVLSEQACVGFDGNVVTNGSVSLRFSVTALESIENHTFIGWVFSEDGDSSLGYIQTALKSLEAGGTSHILVSKYMGDVLVPGNTYRMWIEDYTTREYIPPYEYSQFTFKVVDGTGLSPVVEQDGRMVNVYSATGMLLRRGVEKVNALDGLPRGMYIVDGRKVIKR